MQTPGQTSRRRPVDAYTALTFAIPFLLALALHAYFLSGEALVGWDGVVVSPPWSSAVRPWNPLATDPVLIEEPRARLFADGAPRWNPYTHMGETVGQFNWPFPDYPPAHLYRWVPTWLAKGLLSILHLAAAGLCMLLYLRWRGLSRRAALVGCIAYELSTLSTFWLEASFFHWPMAPWAVLALWGAEAVAREPTRLRAAALAGIALGGAILAGHPQHSVLLSGVVACVLARGASDSASASAGRPRVFALALVALVAGLVGAARLVPLACEFLAGARAAVPWDEFYATSARVGPRHLLSSVFPDLFGQPVRGFNLLKGGPLESYANHQEVRLYVGLPVLVLACAGIGKRWRTGTFALLIGLALLFAFESPLGRLLHALPGFGSSSPTRTLWVVHLLVPVLAACGFERLRRGDDRALKIAYVFLVLGLGVAALCTQPWFVDAILFPPHLEGLEPGHRSEMARLMTERVLSPFSRGNLGERPAGLPGLHLMRGGGREALFLSPTLGPVLLLLLTTGAVWLAARRPQHRALGCALVAGLIAGELLHEGLVYNPSTPPDALYPATATTERLHALAGPHGRVLLDRGLRENSLMPLGLRAVGGYGSMQSTELVALLRALGCEPGRQYVSARRLPANWRDAFAVRAVLARSGAQPTVPGGLVRDLDDGKAAVWKNPTALSRARLYRWQAVVSARGRDDALELLTAPGFDPIRQVVLEGLPTFDRVDPNLPGGLAAAAPLEIVVDDPQRVVVRVSDPVPTGGGVLVLADGAGAGWSASANGAELTVLGADVALRAVLLSQGFAGDVEFTYSAPGVEPGRWLTFFTLLGLLLVLWRRRPSA